MKKSKTYIIGHKHPDTDSIVSALAYAYFKKKLGFKNVYAARASALINAQTNHILKKLNIEPPMYLSDVYPKVKDIMIHKVICLKENNSLSNALDYFKKYKIRFLPIVNNKKEPVGIITLSLITDNLLKLNTNNTIKTSIKIINNVINGSVLTPEFSDLNEIKKYEVLLTTGKLDTFKKLLKKNAENPKIIITDDRYDLQRIALSNEYNTKLLILSKICTPSNTILKMAAKKNITIISSELDSTTITLLLRQTIPVNIIMSDFFVTIKKYEKVELAQEVLEENNVKGLIVQNDDNKLIGLVTKSTFLNKKRKKIILVDHNEPSQSVDGIEESDIIGIIDHHRIAPINTNKPITFINYPVGSTSTIVAMQFQIYDIIPNEKIATLLISGILSDTVILKSPTTTKTDKKMVTWLNKFAKINYKQFATEFFKAGSKFNKNKIEEMIKSDFKEFNIESKKIAISQIETVGFVEFFKYLDLFEKYLYKIYNNKKYFLLSLMITDISLQKSLLLVITDNKTLKAIPFNKIKNNNNLFELKGVLSRKKQVLPVLIKILGRT